MPSVTLAGRIRGELSRTEIIVGTLTVVPRLSGQLSRSGSGYTMDVATDKEVTDMLDSVFGAD